MLNQCKYHMVCVSLGNELTGIGTDRDEEHTACLAGWESECLPTQIVKDWQWNPQDGKSECTNQTAKGIGENGATARASAFWRTGKPFIQDLIEAIENTTDTNNDVT